MNKEFIDQLFVKHKNSDDFPTSEQVCDFTTSILQILFPSYSKTKYFHIGELYEGFNTIEIKLLLILNLIRLKLNETPEEIVKKFLERLPQVYELMNTDLAAIVQGDPAARSEFEVIRSYPGFHAIAMFRIANELFKQNIPVIPRIITEFAHSRTGIDIHPGASIASHFCIDHGTGIVIGETCIIGEYVKIYQGVTLGALSVDKSMAEQKRHPTIEDNVIVYSNATILGGNTVIGHHSVIGGNVWLTKSVPAHTTIYHKSQIAVSSNVITIKTSKFK